jgi:type I restriction enzyme S subunit
MGQSPKGDECNLSGEGCPLLNGPTEFQLIHPLPVQWTINPKKISKSGDLLFCVRGSTTGRMNWSDQEYAIGRGLASISPLYEETMHFFRGVIERHLPTLLAGATGSTFPNVSRSDLESIPILHTDIRYIRNASAVLKGLQDKIELNQKMNQTLEDIAKAIFKSWFVDFDPVRAKAEGRPTGLPPEISDLFPDKLVDSEIGEIPKGWELTTLGDHTALTKGRSYKSAELMDSDTALVTLKSFHRGGGYRLDGLKPYTGIFKPEQVVEEGDLIIALTDVTQAADVIGKPAIVRSSTSHSQLVASLDVGIVRLKENSFFTKEFCYFLMLSNRYTHHSLGYTSGTTVLHLAKDASAKFQVCAPPIMLIENFTDLASNLMRRIFVSEKEIEVLSELRDTLLPKLISGELHIPDAEKFLEEAGI